MSNVLRHNRKGSDDEILRLNAVGLSLQTIGTMLNCHPSTVVIRLKSLDVESADTRRSFMEDIYKSLPADLQEVLVNALIGADPKHPRPVKDYIKELVLHDLERRQAEAIPNKEPMNDNDQQPGESASLVPESGTEAG